MLTTYILSYDIRALTDWIHGHVPVSSRNLIR